MKKKWRRRRKTSEKFLAFLSSFLQTHPSIPLERREEEEEVCCHPRRAREAAEEPSRKEEEEKVSPSFHTEKEERERERETKSGVFFLPLQSGGRRKEELHTKIQQPSLPVGKKNTCALLACCGGWCPPPPSSSFPPLDE